MAGNVTAYFVAWSVSFYPQLILNYRRKSVSGLSIDFLVYNVYGFACYAASNTAFYFSASIDEEYAKRHSGHGNLVRPNDLFFSYHALLLSVLTFGQTFLYPRARNQRASPLALSFFLSTSLGLLCAFLFSSAYSAVYCLSLVKLACSLIKYVPQAWSNYTRRSTAGWSIHNIMLDFTGGVLSFAQLLLDALRTGGVRAVVGNPVKLGLGLTSIAFDLLFMTQHYVLYMDRRGHKDVEARLGLGAQANYGTVDDD
ncbi:hypothetical protein LPJ73_006334, partial [Coemansia sp. RSA 2703]